MLLRIIAIFFGILLIFVGIAGYLPQFIFNDLLFGLFLVSGFRNILHIVMGVLAIMAATSFYYTRLYFQAAGVIYLSLAILGVVLGGDLYYFQVNAASSILHAVLGLVSLYLGFGMRPRPAE